MKLYHYEKKPHSVTNEGLLSFAWNKNTDLSYYFSRSRKTTHSEIVKWMENSFIGRSRGIRVLIEPLKYTEKTKSIQRLIEESDLFEIDLDALIRDDLIEDIYVSPSVLEQKPKNPCDELLVWINGGAEIDYTPVVHLNKYKVIL